jgi:hypothetical protein
MDGPATAARCRPVEVIGVPLATSSTAWDSGMSFCASHLSGCEKLVRRQAAVLPATTGTDPLVRLVKWSVILEDLFQRGGVKDVFGPLFQLFDGGGLQPSQCLRAVRAEAAGELARSRRADSHCCMPC